ncbi:MAG TPA: NPCBM/NEW2 domain-containing protein [Phycisphaerae bacterium]|nr:NPCBM/NEW2 domain-containing protein [Phycisphaerae bacterium]HNU46067.1 NPCBM/NEW2 domain-containing protein [Phycisphaerae bacterium]
MDRGMRNYRAGLLAVSALLAGTASLRAPAQQIVPPPATEPAAPATPASPEAPPVVIRVQTIAESRWEGVLEAFSLQEGLRLRPAGSAVRSIAAADVVRIKTGSTPVTPGAGHWIVRLAGGDVLYGRPVDSTAEGLRLETAELGVLDLSLDVLCGLHAPVPAAAAGADRLSAFERASYGREDAVLMANGDVLRGFVTAVSGQHVVIESGTEARQVPLGLVVAVRLAAGEPVTPTGLYGVAFLAQGGRVTLTEMTWAADHVQARLRAGPVVRFPAGELLSLEVYGGRWEWLARRAPTSFQHTPMLGLDFGWAANRNVLGGLLRVAGQDYEHGLGVHSRCRLVYDLGGGFTVFTTSFGMDDDSGPLADVAVLVLIDGQPRFEQSQVRVGKLHGPLRLDVTGARRLELLVDFGDHGDIQDRFDWIEPALVR